MLLLRVVDADPNPVPSALIRLMLTMGLRVSEATAVRIEDFQDTIAGSRVLRIMGKGAKPRTAPVDGANLTALERAAGARTEGVLLRQPDNGHAWGGEPLSRKAVQTIITNACREAGIDKPLRPHGLRHSYATIAFELGVAPQYIQHALGHAQITTTLGYDHSAQNLAAHANRHVGAAYARAS